MRRTLWMGALLGMAASAASAGTFVVRPGGESKVTFLSKATIESFTGKTGRLEGRVVVDTAAVGDSITAHLEVDLASLDTGNAHRNRNMRDQHLETDKFPKAIFDGAAVLGPTGARLAAGQPVTIQIEGTFTLHGVSRRLRVEVEATYSEKEGSGRIAFHTVFPVNLADYAVTRPEFLFLKLAESQEVRVSALAVAAP